MMCGTILVHVFMEVSFRYFRKFGGKTNYNEC